VKKIWDNMNEEEREEYVNQDYIPRSYILANPDTFSDEEYKMEWGISKKCRFPYKMLRCLTQKQKQIIILFFRKEMTQKEIAKKLKIKQATVSRRLSRAIKKLKEEYLNKLNS